jgi:hypothetical protein
MPSRNLPSVVGGVVIAHGAYRTLGIVLAIGMATSAGLILRVDDRPGSTGEATGGKVPGSGRP